MRKAQRPAGGVSKEGQWELDLYVAGHTARSIAAFQNLQRICREHVIVGCNIQIIDVLQSPQLAVTENIVALPMLVRKVPGDRPRRMIGDLSDTQKVLRALGLGN
ncbi:MAG: circadian clock protein KaiB [Acidobacteria bacterium]|nr:MAG: circadian clock protein KaiB [Acidobacteriota bacterium]